MSSTASVAQATVIGHAQRHPLVNAACLSSAGAHSYFCPRPRTSFGSPS